jgi:glyoxylase-like metal-dependent hydrolase (beta-lactamase superfamily II)
MIFSKDLVLRPLFEKETSTLTYLLFSQSSKKAVIIDPVDETTDRDCRIIEELGLDLEWIFETHLHADHITSADFLAEKFNAKIGISNKAKVQNSRVEFLEDAKEISICEDFSLKVLLTPGHTNCSMSLLVNDFLFTGDTLFIRGCGRTDFQGGSNKELFESVRNKLFTLDDSTLVLPGHDYKGETFSTIYEEKTFNPRLKLSNSLEEFSSIMNNLDLSYPKKIDVALPANKHCGKTND